MVLLTACNKIDLNNVGYDDADRLKASAVRSALLNTSGGFWKANYLGHEFFFTFDENGNVFVDSDFLNPSKKDTYRLSTKGRGVLLELVDGGHFSLLSGAGASSKFVVEALSAAPAAGLTFAADGGGTEKLLLEPTTKAYIDGKAGLKKEFVDMMEKGYFENRVISDDQGRFIAYYSLTMDYIKNDYAIQLISLENRNGKDPNGHTQYYSSKLIKEGTSFRLENPIAEIKATNGKVYSFSSLLFGETLAVQGMPNVKIASNKNALSTFDYSANKKWSFNKKQNQGGASDEIWNVTAGDVDIAGVRDFRLIGLDVFDPGMRAKERSLVFWTGPGFRTRVWIGSAEGADIRKNNELDRISFQNLNPDGLQGSFGSEHAPAEVAAMKVFFKPLFDAWYDEQGFYVAKTQGTDGKTYIYLLGRNTSLTANGGAWIKCQ